MSEVLARGPVTCGLVCPDEFAYGYDGGIFHYHGNETDMDHDIEIVGWGEENGERYWTARNSWGTYWGENGFFRVPRGVNHLRIEESCTFALLEEKELREMEEHKVTGSMFGIRPVERDRKPPPREEFPKDYEAPPNPFTKAPEEPVLPVKAVPVPVDAIDLNMSPQLYGVAAVGAVLIIGSIALLIWGKQSSGGYESL